ncbi:Bdr family repetitive protein [Borrelia sp. P9F1]|uniref:Bdr family repetitive protein n=1 Tax=Borrelia sp. P9F1 TaxID=3058374 RepID=UPI0026473482|nr:Bdr family repetitive protein [Borrelia sp. P9F1]WKC58642.1 Bdr family repetitive protein [Borrelia sp. P9F1]
MNTVERVSDYDYVRQVFLDKGFPEEVIQYVLIRNANYNYENLRIRMSALEDQMVAIRNALEKVDGKIESVRRELVVEIKESRNELNGKIDKLDEKIESKIDKSIGAAIRPLYWIFGFISTFTVGVFVALLTILFKQ